MLTAEHKLDQASLERLVIAVMECCNAEGKHVMLAPRDVLSPWATAQMPDLVKELPHG